MNEPGENVPVQMLQIQCTEVLFFLISNKFKLYFHISKPFCVLETECVLNSYN